MKKDNEMKIDFVITWVDGGDKDWIIEKNKYASHVEDVDNAAARYRDWDILKYWFRSVEENAPWVNKIHFVTCGQIPSWLNVDNPKLNVVNHTDFIPLSDLPVFNSCAIEVNFHNIPELAEHFVYFNDDMFLNRPVKPTDFFQNGKPMDSAVFTPVVPTDDITSCIHYNCMKTINRHFNYQQFIKTNRKKVFNFKYGKYLYKNVTLGVYPFYVGFRFHHLPTSFLKSTFSDVWSVENKYLSSVSKNRFRDCSDVSQWLFQFWQLASGNFEPRRCSFGKYYDLSKNFETVLKELENKKYSILCLNDNRKVDKFLEKRDQLKSVFEKIYPSKSSFEK